MMLIYTPIDKTPKLGFVFTNFNNSEYTKAAIQSLHQDSYNTGNCHYIVVVDNRSDLEHREMLKSIENEYKNVHVLLSEVNLGYFGGLNIGIRYLRAHDKNIENIIVGNNDLLFPKGFFNSFYKILPMLQVHAVISPDIVTMDGAHQNPHVIRRISKFREQMYDIYYSNYYLAVIIEQIAKITKKFTDRDDEQQHRVPQEIHQGYGCCYILGPLFFKNFEELWAPTFLMGEEFFLSLQLKNKDLHIYYEPSVSIVHQCKGSTSKIPQRRKWEFGREAHKIYRKHVKIWR